ncbi:MAG: hypothetical protein JHC33_12140 [Ignisphaera sp.]|nr:hypothetical protein [Ignisphaera sp.]
MNTTNYVGHKIYVVNEDGTVEFLPIFVNIPKDIDAHAFVSLLEECKWGLEETSAKQTNTLLAKLRK